mmetsp:Transcript_20748/g.31405  ORF Transcript_20748/g.31405 Transcript_20748/m.31405 type:complete len:588 (-) Transcript_20748:1271-3034(-)|eukprot:CAMPEP_0194264482 /NCGR_PEP_ID=MMETSP0158-20130606/47605_1 /TAXON_ID=33649 /ORGANISM="Thalassionema nitzschioides, Strain L26-B" /LENGTH=587 /DNA_ID=CAMNT_0039004721 /DNA_START=138 /DNA_END=1901 /DNA_ORIENTATION=+
MRPKKKTKFDHEVIEKAWDHFRNFLDSCAEEGNEEGDIDELHEITKNLEDTSLGCDANVCDTIQLGSTREELLPILVSMAHYHLANNIISQTVDQENDTAQDKAILKHLQASLHHFPHNCSTWSVGANYARMQQSASLSTICQWFKNAATCASALRTQTLDLLEGKNDVDEESVKEWLELLILNGMTGTEYVGSDVKEEISEEEEEDDEQDNEESLEEGFFSSSSVEATSRFMGAMIQSTLGNHDDALCALQHFDLTHRIHPNVWECKVNDKQQKDLDGPTFFRGEVLPKKLYDKMCQVFAPDAAYWKESDYAHRGYYSYFFDIDEPSNLIEDVIVNHLLPLAKGKCKNPSDKIIGAEWWPHTRPIQANLGHNLHFDTDESILEQEGVVSHPLLSSVLYLTSGYGSTAGSTVILNQSPDSKEEAKECWSCKPGENSFMVFDGNLLHGVLPCPGQLDTRPSHPKEITWGDTQRDPDSVPHRLTFMVGFWTRRVPDKMKGRKVYGPCGMLPQRECTEWVKQIYDYPKLVERSKTMEETQVPKISPAWQHISAKEDIDLLEIPQALDHRFFVKGVPECFHESLFEKDIES